MMKAAKAKTPQIDEVIRDLELENDPKLACLLLDWFKARKLWQKNRDGKIIGKVMGESILAIDDYLLGDPERKARLMNEMINRYA